jgi:hypothetical protein
MVAKAVNVFQPFLSFACEFQSDKAHNMFDLFYKSMQCIIELLGREAAKNVVTEYDMKVMIPLLIKVNKLLNPTGDNTTIEIADFFANSLFDAPTSAEEIREVLLVSEFSIFCCVVVLEEEVAKPLTWWKDHANNPQMLPFWLGRFLEYLIPKLRLRIFLVTGLLTSLRCFCLGIIDLYTLVMIYKNWPNDAKDVCILAWVIVLLQQLLLLKFFSL